jgi:hypothetical protein
MASELLVDDLAAHEEEQQRQRVLQVHEPRNQCGERKIEGAKAEHREDVRRIDQIGFLRDGEDRRHTFQGEGRVCAFDEHQRQEQRRHPGDGARGIARVRHAHEEGTAV